MKGAGTGDRTEMPERQVPLQTLFLRIRSSEDLGGRRGWLGSGRLSGVTGHCARPRKPTDSSFLLERTKGQMPQVWEGLHCSCRAGPAHTNKAGSAKGVRLHPAQTPGEASRNWERAGQREGDAPISQQLPAHATTPRGSGRTPQREAVASHMGLCFKLPSARATQPQTVPSLQLAQGWAATPRFMAVPFQVAGGGAPTTSRAGLGRPLLLCLLALLGSL